jgi:hypothetical protein
MSDYFFSLQKENCEEADLDASAEFGAIPFCFFVGSRLLHLF